MRRALLAVAVTLLMITTGCAGNGSNPAPSGGNGDGDGGNFDGSSVGVAAGGAQDAQDFIRTVVDYFRQTPTRTNATAAGAGAAG